MKYELVYAVLPPDMALIGDGDLTVEHQEWMQHAGRWSAFYYHHVNAVTVDTQTIAVTPGSIAFFPPNKRCAHAKVGEGTSFAFVSFNMPARAGQKLAIPYVVYDMERVLPDLTRALNRIVDSVTPTIAFAWNLMWSVGQNLSVFRGLEVMYEAEAYIGQRLAEPISIPAMCDSLQISQRKLLMLFRQEHGISIQEFIVRTRVKEASRLLLTTVLPIKEIAFRVGFTDLQHFNKTIRAATGQSPSALRRLKIDNLSLR